MDFMKRLYGDILTDWQQVLQQLEGLATPDTPPPRSNHSSLLQHIADLADRCTLPEPLLSDQEAELYLQERLAAGYSLREVVAELSLLRDSIIRCSLQDPRLEPLQLRRLLLAVDAVIGVVIAHYEKGSDTSQVLDAVGHGICSFDYDGRCTYANPIAARVLGYLSPSRLVGRRLHELVHQIEGQPEMHLLEECPLECARALSETRHRDGDIFWSRDGRCFSAEYWLSPSWNGETRVGSVLSFVDITERKRDENEHRRLRRELEAQRTLFAAVLEQLPAGVAIIEHPTGRPVRTNRRFEALLRASAPPAKEAGDFARYQAFHPEDGRPYQLSEWPILRALVCHEVVTDERMEVPRLDGTWTPVLARATPVHDGEGHLLGAVLLTHERSRLEDAQHLFADVSALLVEDRDLDLALTSVTSVLTSALADWCAIELVSRDGSRHRGAAHRQPGNTARLRELLRYWQPRAEDLQRSMPHNAPLLLPQVTPELLHQLCTDGSGQEGFWKGVLELGLRSLVIVPLVARGHTLGMMVLGSAGPRVFGHEDTYVAMELGRRIALAADRSGGEPSVAGLVHSRQDSLAAVSHELKNALNIVNLSVALLDRRLLEGCPADAMRHTSAIQRASRLMLCLIHDLLDLSSGERGRFSLQTELCDVAPLVNAAVAMFQDRAASRNIRLSVPRCVDGVLVRCDYERLLQVFSNLLGNALRFSDEGGTVRVTVEVKRQEVRFAISDRGPGAPLEDLAHVFDPFWWSERHPQQGYGLGLSVSKGIVEMHGGRIWVRSAPSKGTTFYFTLPLARPA